MPCPEKFRDSLAQFQVDEDTVRDIMDGYESLVSSSPKAKKAAFFKRALDVLDERLEPEDEKRLLAWCACCKSGARDRASREFARINKELPVEARLAKIAKAPYLNMGRPLLEASGLLRVDAVSYFFEGRFICACSNFRRLKSMPEVSRNYCWCCGGHFQYHYQLMLARRLELLEIVSSPLDTGGEQPCVFRFRLSD